MIKIDMKEAGKKLVEKQPFRIIMDDHDKKGTPATEYTNFVDVLTFSVYGVGQNFQNIPFATTTSTKYMGIETKTVGLINQNGDIVCQVPSSEYNKFKNPDEFRREKERFKFNCNDDEIIIALKLTENPARGGSYSYLLLLKEPLTVEEMQKRRDSSVFSAKKKVENESLSKIEMLWGNKEEEVA